MAWRSLPDTEYLYQCFSYDPASGTVTWRHRPREHFKTAHEFLRWNTRMAGAIAGSSAGSGGIQIRINKRFFAAHRIIWKMMTREDPPNLIDHKNRDRADNRWANLRLATYPENAANKSRYGNNTSGFKGVKILTRTYRRPYQARIRIKGRLIHLGSFKTAEEAHKNYVTAAKHYFGEFWTDGA